MNFGGELFVALGAIGNSKEVQAFGNAVNKAGKAIDDFDKKQAKTETGSKNVTLGIKGIVGATLGLVTAVAGAYFALDRLTDSLAKQNQQWLLMAQQSDIAMSTLQKWDTIGKITGVEGVGQQLESLEQKIFNLKLTGEGARGFQIAGISPTNSEDVLEQLRGRVSGLNNQSATYLLQQMGLDPKMLTLLRMTREEWEEYVEVQKRYTLNEDQRKELEKYNRQLQVARIKMQYLKDRAILALVPAFTKLTKFLVSATEGLARMVKWIVKSQTPLAGLIRIIIGATVAIKGLRLALTLLSAHPIIAGITALIGALMLLADDFNHYMNGGGSIIGVIAKGLEDLDIKGIIDFETPSWLKDLIYAIDNINQLIHFKDIFSDDEGLKTKRQEGLKRAGKDYIKTLANVLIQSNPQALYIKTQTDKMLEHILPQGARQDIRNNTSNTNKVSNVNMEVNINSSQPVEDTKAQLALLQRQTI